MDYEGLKIILPLSVLHRNHEFFLFTVSLIHLLLSIPMPPEFTSSLFIIWSLQISNSPFCLQFFPFPENYPHCSVMWSATHLWPRSPLSVWPSCSHSKNLNVIKINLQIMAQLTHVPKLICLDPNHCLLFPFSMYTHFLLFILNHKKLGFCT